MDESMYAAIFFAASVLILMFVGGGGIRAVYEWFAIGRMERERSRLERRAP